MVTRHFFPEDEKGCFVWIMLGVAAALGTTVAHRWLATRHLHSALPVKFFFVLFLRLTINTLVDNGIFSGFGGVRDAAPDKHRVESSGREG